MGIDVCHLKDQLILLIKIIYFFANSLILTFANVTKIIIPISGMSVFKVKFDLE